MKGVSFPPLHPLCLRRSLSPRLEYLVKPSFSESRQPQRTQKMGSKRFNRIMNRCMFSKAFDCINISPPSYFFGRLDHPSMHLR